MAGEFSPTLWLTVFMTCFGSSFLIGYNLAVNNLPAAHVKDFLGNAFFGPNHEQDTKNNTILTTAFAYAQVNSVFVIAGAIGAFSCGWLADKAGRRNGLLFNNVFAIIGSIICIPVVKTNLPALLYVGRFITGLNCGVTIGLASMFLTEIAPRKLRGVIGACHQLAVTIGITVAYLFTLKFALQGADLWPYAIGIGAVPAIISIVVLPFCPESARFLYTKKNDEVGARGAFMRVNRVEDVDTFIAEMREEVEVSKNQSKFEFKQLFTHRDLRMPILIACIIQIMQQLSGINAVISYSSTMMKTAGIPDTYSDYCVLAIGVLNVLSTLMSLPLIERAGRRTLLLWPTVVVAASLLLLTITVNLTAYLQQGTTAQKAMAIMSVVFILIYITGFALGLGPVPALIVAEIFRQEPRAAAYSLSQSIQWTANLIVLFSYPSIDNAIGGYAFLPFMIVVVICWVFFFLFMPETRGRTFDEVARDLAFGNVVVGKRTATLEGKATGIAGKGADDYQSRAPNPGDELVVEPLLKGRTTSTHV